MKSLLLFALLPLCCVAQEVKAPVRHEFVIKNFKTEGGVVLPEAHIVYGTYGTLNAARDNAVLLPSHYMAGRRGYEWLMGPDKALDPGKLFLVTTELFGNGSSSSPSNTPKPFDGPRFPLMTIRDNVEAAHRLLTEDLGITHLRAVIGFSMGAQQALQWAVSYPTFMDRVVATSGTAKTYPHGIVRLEGQIAAITADPVFANGDYTAPPTKGLEAFGTVWLGWLFSQEWWHEELWRAEEKPGTTFQEYFEHFRKNFIPNADANNLILQMRTWESNDVGATKGFGAPVKGGYAGNPGEASTNAATERALASIRVPVLYMPSATDMYFPVTDAAYEARFIPKVIYLPIPSLWGHTAGAASNPADGKFLNEKIGAFMQGRLGAVK